MAGYPENFTRKAKAAVEAAKIRARKNFKTDIRSHGNKPHASTVDQSLRKSVMMVFSAFAHEACELGRSGKWDVDEVARQCDQFLRDYAVIACQELGWDGDGQRIPNWIILNTNHLEAALERELKELPEWDDYEGERLGIADLQASVPPTLDTKSQTRRTVEARPELLKGKDEVTRTHAALALGVTTRSIDRYAADGSLHPSGRHGKRMFKCSELLELTKGPKARRPKRQKRH